MNKDQLLTKNIAKILPSKEEFKRRLARGAIKIYFGVDPSAPEIHLGHAVVLWKLREFQDAGHKVILLIGDFTGMIGDPSDRTAARKKLTRKQVLENAKTYKDQLGKILRFSGTSSAEIKFNSEWLSKLFFEDVLELASYFTAQQMLERDFFQERIKKGKPIHLNEFLYPLMQGYDSVAMDVDAEIGGTDQTFNMLVGRTLIKALKNKHKFVVTVPLLEGLDGRKMSKSFGNIIPIAEESNNMFGKIMSLHDKLIFRYFKLATRLSREEIQSIEQLVQSNKLNLIDAKKKLAWEIVNLYHGRHKADEAEREFERVFQKGRIPEKVNEFKVKEQTVNLVEFLTTKNLFKSKSEVKRLIEQGGVEINGQVHTSQTLTIPEGEKLILRFGKKTFIRITR